MGRIKIQAEACRMGGIGIAGMPKVGVSRNWTLHTQVMSSRKEAIGKKSPGVVGPRIPCHSMLLPAVPRPLNIDRKDGQSEWTQPAPACFSSPHPSVFRDGSSRPPPSAGHWVLWRMQPGPDLLILVHGQTNVDMFFQAFKKSRLQVGR